MPENQDSQAVNEFRALIQQAGEKNRPPGETSPLIVKYKTENPDQLLISQQAKDLLNSAEVQKELVKTQEPNATMYGNIVEIRKWMTEDGSKKVDVFYQLKGINLPFNMGFQLSETDPSFNVFNDLPSDFHGQVIVKTNEKGRVKSFESGDF